MFKVQMWPVERLIPYARNPRNNDHAVERMCAVLREFGMKIPLLARSSGEVVDGHLRLKAALRMQLPELPVVLCDEWTEPQVKAFRLMVNRSATWADWNNELLALEFEELQELSYDLSLTGFDRREIDDLLLPDDESEPEQREQAGEPVSQTGDIWECGKHRVLCGDATCTTSVSRLLGATVPVLMSTDPPYGVNYDPLWREQAGLGRQRQSGRVANDDRADWTAAYELFRGDVAYVWHAGLHAGEVARNLEQAGFAVRAQIIWAKQHFALSRGDYHWKHEPAWYAVRQGRSSRWRGDRTQSTLWEVSNLNAFGGKGAEDAVTGHGTQKPVELVRRPILNHTEPGEAIYDPFLGSGTTLIAAQQTGRVCLGIEIQPCYIDAALLRWSVLSGKEPVLAGEGRSFEQIRKTRSHRIAAARDNLGGEAEVA